jgi:glycosyltransferase involved in cell wall biosynthesis
VRVWIDVEDLFQYITGSRRPSGVQRLVYELVRAMRDVAGADRVRFLRHNLPGITFGEVAWEEVEALFRGMVVHTSRRRADTAPPMESPLRSRLRRLVYRLPLTLRSGLIRFGRAETEALRALGSIAKALRPRRTQRRQDRIGAPLAALVQPGDTLAVLGAPWSNPRYAEMLAHARGAHRMKILLLVYDLIPIRRPEWCDRSLVQTFSHWFDSTLPLADTVLAISRATARDVERYAARQGLHLPGPVGVVPIGTGLGTALAAIPPGDAAGLPAPGSYALFVSTLEARKNHQLLFRVWRQLLEDMPAAQVPTLVFAGRVGWLVQDLMQQLRNAAWLGGKVVFIEDPSDAELVQLYRGCLFTLFPSLFEGWGLPVTESLALGKPCVAANVTSLPESGGPLARYFDPDDLADAVRVIRATIEDRDGLAAWTGQVAREFRPVAWQETAQAVLAHVG